jgi:hypothetical protein
MENGCYNDSYLDVIDEVIKGFGELKIPGDEDGMVRNSILLLFVELRSKYLELRCAEFQNKKD